MSFLRPERRRARPGAEVADERPEDPVGDLLRRVARGDERAFEGLYDAVAGPVHGVVLRVLRDPAQSEEVTQEVMVEVWKQAPRYDAARGSARGWVLTIAHRRAVDRVRSAQASTDREGKVAARDADRAFDVVTEEVEHRLEAEQVRRSLDVLTDLQRESVELAYYGGYTHRQVAEILGIPLGTVKTRLRDGLIRLRDEMGVVA
ncbi:ECF RNA polymerase sigma factor SigK [Pseudokineococcus marinus]|uniref:ECF RNA polymerase sigma factor SigK n=1 Tax=Pseudokineococcus marinus TaxID=351215 RepID=A0A849BYH5_9ACTN|nr:ECF RNA polymerase sigma factor SigK [Pseudokineococcus marinus]NNH22568.1 ECF RNA polymerase sigma factor SigK [Pseudokineococcus marinus]